MCFSKLPNSLFILQELKFETSRSKVLQVAGESPFSEIMGAIAAQLFTLRSLESPLATVQRAMRQPSQDSMQAAYEETFRFAQTAYAIFNLWDRADALILELISETCLRGEYAFGNASAQNHNKLSSSTAQLSQIYCLLSAIVEVQEALYKCQVPNNISNYKRFRTQIEAKDDEDVYRLFSRETRYNHMFNQFGAVQMLHHTYKNTLKNDPSEFRIYAILSAGEAIFEKSQQVGAVLMSVAHALFYNDKDAGLCSGRRKELVGCYVRALEGPTQFLQLEPGTRDIIIAVIENYAESGKPIWLHPDCDKALGKLFK